MAKIFNDGDEVTKEWLNGVSKTVTDGLGDNVAPATIRVHINAEQAGAASQVQTNLDTHKADASIHTPSADVVLQAEKGVANGIPTLDGSTKIPATFLPATGGYAGVYDTQALMVAAAAGHTSGEIFLVTNDPTPALNGEYTATATPPASIADYYFNSDAVAAHTHNAADVNVVALGHTVEVDSQNIHIELDLKANDADLTTHTGNTGIHFADAPIDGVQYVRKDGSWAAAESVSGGDLKADGSVPMAGGYVPALEQDIATKTSSEAVFTDRLAGLSASGTTEEANPDLDTIVGNCKYSIYASAITSAVPVGSNPLARVLIETTSYHGINGASQKYTQLRNAAGDVVSAIYRRDLISGVWGDWVDDNEGLSTHQHDTNQIPLTSVISLEDSLVDAYTEHTTPPVQYRFRTKTQVAYDAIATPRDDTIYFIVG